MSRAVLLLACVALGCGFGALPSGAAEPPPPRTRPSRDVVVTYQMEGEALLAVPGGIRGPVRLSWDAAGQRVRAEAEGRSQVALLDLKNHGGQAFDTALRIVLPLPVKEKDLQPLTMEGLHLSAKGRETVAGLSCSAYAFETPHGPGSVCLTADGVPLRGQGKFGGRPGSFTALSVSYGRLPPGLFEVPAGYIALGGAGPGQGSGGVAALAQRLGGAAALRNMLGLPR